MLLLTAIAIVFFANIILGFFVLMNNPKNLVNRSFAAICLGLSFWAVFNYLADYNLVNSLLWSRLSFLSIIISLAFLIIFLNNFPFKIFKNRTIGITALISALIVGFISLLPQFITGVEIQNQTSNIQTGSLYLIYLVYFAVTIIAALTLIFISWRKSSAKDMPRLKLLVFGILSMTLLGSITNLILPLLSGNNYYAKFGTLFTLIFVGFTAYAIIKHSLFDIRAVVVRSFAYVFSIITIATVYAFIAFGVIGRYLFPSSSQQITTQQQIFNTALAVVLAFTFQPIKRFFEKISNKIFYRGHYDSQLLIDELGHLMASEIRISQLCKKVSSEIINKLKVSNLDIIVLDNHEIIFSTKNINSSYGHINLITKLGEKISYIDELPSGEKSHAMKNLNVTLSIPLKTGGGFMGFMLLDQKQSGQIYNEEDIKTLKIIANELSVALENAKAFLEIKKFNQTLQERIDRATKSLKKANAQLKELDEAKDEFISMASHQLRTPLTTVKGYVSMLDEGDFGKLTKDQKHSVELALDGSNRMARLIDDLLNVSRMEAGKFYIDPTKVNINNMVEQEVSLLQTLAKGKKVNLSYVQPKSKIPAMNLDDNKTRQVIMNLVDNAIHYSEPPNGGGRVVVHLDIVEDNIVFKVVDNGIGVPKDQQEHLFTKMFRAKNAKEVRPDGTGLGLFLVKRVVEDQGGKIVFESKPGKGSTFGFTMPTHNSIKVDEKAKKMLIKAQSK